MVSLQKEANGLENSEDVGGTVLSFSRGTKTPPWISLPLQQAFGIHLIQLVSQVSTCSDALPTEVKHAHIGKRPQPNRTFLCLSFASPSESETSLRLSSSSCRRPISLIPVNVIVARLSAPSGLFESVANDLLSKATKIEKKSTNSLSIHRKDMGYHLVVVDIFRLVTKYLDTRSHGRVCIPSSKCGESLTLILNRLFQGTLYISAFSKGEWTNIYLRNKRCFLKSNWKTNEISLISGKFMKGWDSRLKSNWLIPFWNTWRWNTNTAL